MKKILSLLFVVVSLAANAKDFKLSVTMANANATGKCYILWVNGDDGEHIDSVDIVAGKAVWSHDFQTPVMASIKVESPQLNKARRVRLIFLPNEKCNVAFTAEGGKIGGSKVYKKMGEAVEFIVGQTQKNKVQVMTDYLQKYGHEEWASVLAMECGLDFFLKNAQPTARIKKLFEDVKVMQDKEQEVREKEAQKAMDALLNNPAPEFTLEDLNGNQLALSSLRGKYVVLDFWGAWCVWCMRGVPKMKEYYAKYKDKMEILGIDCRDTKEKWRKTVAENELSWLHVYNPNSSDLTKRYAIQGYPTKIVIDPDGKLIKIIVGEDPEFYTYLDELFSGGK